MKWKCRVRQRDSSRVEGERERVRMRFNALDDAPFRFGLYAYIVYIRRDIILERTER